MHFLNSKVLLFYLNLCVFKALERSFLREGAFFPDYCFSSQGIITT